MARQPIVRLGQSAWRVRRARRAAFLVDAAAYFAALDAAFDRAERQILILGWDIDSRTQLGGWGSKKLFVDKLNALAAKRPELEVYILSWDYATFYLLEREFMPSVQLGLLTHRRVHFRLDDDHPLGASHHQKVVVVDDEIAFAGGLDITVRRWDTPEHAPVDDKRRDPSGVEYAPFHDVQMAVSGPAATALGDLARLRWARATGETLARPRRRKGAALDETWPRGLPADAVDVDVAIVRTEPAFRVRGRAEVREGEALTIRAIEAARSFIYLENQYFTSRVVVEALSARLAERDGPEVVVVGPECCSGWFEEQTMGVLRQRALQAVLAADVHARLRVVYPRRGDASIFVHSKVCVVDDRFVRVGSSNLTNRSTGLDTECDLAIDAATSAARGGRAAEARAKEASLGLLSRLLAEHLGSTPIAVRAALDAELAEAARGGRASLFAVIDGAPRVEPERGLAPVVVPEEEAEVTGIAAAADPEGPLEATELIERAVPEAPRSAERSAKLSLVVVVGIVALGLVVRFTPLGAGFDLESLRRGLVTVRDSAWAPLAVTALFVGLGLVMVPVNALILATGAAFGPVRGPIYAVLGALASALFNYGLGRHFGARALRRFGGDRARAVASRLSERGFAAVLLMRVLPTAPFGLVNLAAGACGVRSTHFALATFLGTLPGAIALGLFGSQLFAALLGGPRGPFGLALGIAAVIALAIASFWLRRRRRRRAREESEAAREEKRVSPDVLLGEPEAAGDGEPAKGPAGDGEPPGARDGEPPEVSRVVRVSEVSDEPPARGARGSRLAPGGGA